MEVYPTDFARVANHRTEYLTKSGAIWHAYQLTLAFVKDSNDKLTNELIKVMELKGHDEEIHMRKDLAKQMVIHIEEINDKTGKYEILIDKIMVVGSELEKQTLSFKNISKFADNDEVKDAIKIIKNKFQNAD